MNKEKTPIGLKKNADKILFILATSYLIFISAWALKNRQVDSNISQQKIYSEKTVNNKQKLENSNSNVEEKIDDIKDTINLETQSQSTNPSPNNKNLKTPQNPIVSTPPWPPSIQPTPPIPPPINTPQTIQVVSTPIQPLIPLPTQQNYTPTPVDAQHNKKREKETSLPVLNSNSNNQNISYNSTPNLSSSISGVKVNSETTLLGLVEIENLPTIALFKVNKLTERVKVGEEIGTSGWVLVAIKDKKTVVNKNGKTIRVTVGDKF